VSILWLLAVAWVFGSVFVTGHMVLLKLSCVCKCVVIGTLSEMNILSRKIQVQVWVSEMYMCACILQIWITMREYNSLIMLVMSKLV